MAEPTRQQLLTAEQMQALPEDGYRHELQAGLLLRDPHPVARHARTAVRLAALLEPRAVVQGAVVVADMDFVLARRPDTVRAPDLAIFTRQQWDAMDPDRPFEGAPALAIEVLSPSNKPSHVHAKVADYLAAGVTLVWAVDPWTWTVRCYRTLLAPLLCRGEDRLDGGAVLADLDLRAQDLFDPDLPAPR